MEPFEVLITKTVYTDDDEGNEEVKIVFGPKLIFAYTKDEAKIKASIQSNISSDEVTDLFYYVRNF